MKRCVIYSFNDPAGIADDYVFNMLSALREYADLLVVVISGFITGESGTRLRASSDQLIERPPFGGRAGAFREALFTIGFPQLAGYDEVILTDDMLFGPLYPLSELFETMDKRSIDLWGIVNHFRFEGDRDGIYGYEANQEFIDPHFLALRKSLVTDFSFKNFLFNRPDPKDAATEYTNFDKAFTWYFVERGFKWSVYSDTARYEGITVDPFAFEIQNLIAEDRCPFVLKSVFYGDYLKSLNHNCGEVGMETLRVIRSYTSYDIRLIFGHLLRICDQSDIRQAIHPDFFLPPDTTEHEREDPYEGAVFIFGTREKFEETAYRYKDAFPACMKRIFFDGSESYIQKLVMAGRMARRYKYVCVINLFDMTRCGWSHGNWSSLFYQVMENTVPTPAFIENVYYTFEREPWIGMMVPPVANYGIFFWKIGDGWEGMLEPVKKALADLSIRLDIHEIVPHPLIPYGGSFWIRGGLFAKIASLPLESVVQDELVMCFLLPYLAQHMSYMTGMLMNTEYAPIEISNEDYKLRLNNQMIFKRFGTDCLQYELEKIRGTRECNTPEQMKKK